MPLQVIIRSGGVGERLKPAVLKTVRLERVSGVRIPPPPPFDLIARAVTFPEGLARRDGDMCRNTSVLRLTSGAMAVTEAERARIGALRAPRARA
jgi:hypothetical protein